MNASDVVRVCGTLAVFPANADKAPLTTSGFLDASRDPFAIAEWWMRWPTALVATPTGAVNGFFVVDVDPDGLGWYEHNRGRLECRFTVKTRRGTHLYYRVPAFEVRCSTSRLAPGIDVRGEGGYVVAWWAHGHDADGALADVAPAPDWLLAELRRIAPKNGHVVPAVAPASPERAAIPEGSRNDTLYDPARPPWGCSSTK
jgi:putative DNA primase/helicase